MHRIGDGELAAGAGEVAQAQARLGLLQSQQENHLVAVARPVGAGDEAAAHERVGFGRERLCLRVPAQAQIVVGEVVGHEWEVLPTLRARCIATARSSVRTSSPKSETLAVPTV